MNKILVTVVISMVSYFSFGQLTTMPSGGNKKAIVAEQVGLTDITIHYNRPAVKGRTGQVWGQLVPYGFTDPGFGTSKAAPWRAGANENTTIEFSTDVTIGDKNLPAGKYGFFIATGKDESTAIFSKNNSAWGSYFYDEAEDVLRVPVRQVVLDKPVEFLQFVFLDQGKGDATIALQWENLSFPFKVETDLNKEQVAIFQKELQTTKCFDWQAWAQAANWAAENNTNLEEGLKWADYAISGPFIGQKNFRTLSAKSNVLKKMNKNEEAAEAMQEAVALGTVSEVHGYARQLLSDKKTKEASNLFKANYKNFPNQFTTNVGMARALSSEGKYKDALKYANAALTQATDTLNKNSLNDMIVKLKAGQDVN